MAAPGNGVLSGSGLRFTYTPRAGYVGADQFQFRVRDPQGATSALVSFGCQVHPVPAITSVTPNRGPLAGGTALTINGSGFAADAQVTLGGIPCTGVTVSAGRLDCVTPAGALGPSDLVVRNASGGYERGRAGAFFYEGFEPFRTDLIKVPGGDTDQERVACVVTPAGVIVAVWLDRRNIPYDVYLSRSLDHGLTWETSLRLDQDTTGISQSDPTLAVGPAGELACAWVETRNTPAGGYDVRCRRSLDGGLTWSPATVVNHDPSNRLRKSTPTLAVEPGGAIVCAWVDERETISTTQLVFASRSTDGGASWSVETIVYQGWPIRQETPRLAATGVGRSTCVWANVSDDILCATSADGGLTWTPPVRVNDYTGSGSRSQPTLCTSATGELLCAWRDSRPIVGSGLQIARSSDQGGTWSANRLFLPENGSTLRAPTLGVGPGGKLMCAFELLQTIGGALIRATSSPDDGLTWSSPVALTAAPLEPWDERDPALVYAGGQWSCLWTDQRRGNKDIFLARSGDDGATWSGGEQVNDDQIDRKGQDEGVLEFLPDGTIVAAWTDARGRTTDIFLTRSEDDGRTWSENVRVNEDDGSRYDRQTTPSLAVEPGGALVCVFGDAISAGGGSDISFRRSTDGGRTWSATHRVNDVPGQAQPDMSDIACADAVTLDCVWVDARAGVTGYRDLYHARSTDHGEIWSAGIRLNVASAFGKPVLLSRGSSLWVAAVEDTGYRDVFVFRSNDGGATWSRSQVNLPRAGRRLEPDLVRLSSGDLVCAWRTQDEGIHWSRSSDDGATWSAEGLLEREVIGSALTNHPRLAVEPSGTVWCGYAYHRWIYVRRSTDGGVTWSAPSILQDARTESLGPETSLQALAVSPNGQLGVLGYNPYWRRDIVFARGWFKP